MRRYLFISLLVSLSLSNVAQLTPTDIKSFAYNLNYKRTYDRFTSAYSVGVIRAEYPKYELSDIIAEFEKMGSSLASLERFCYRAYFQSDFNKEHYLLSLYALCDNMKLSQKIYAHIESKFRERISLDKAKLNREKQRKAALVEYEKEVQIEQEVQIEPEKPRVTETEKPLEEEEEEDGKAGYEASRYDGGAGAYYRFISLNLRYTDSASVNNISGTVKCSVFINKEGTVDSVNIMSRRLGYGLDEEAMRILKKTIWIPAKKNGVPVPSVKQQVIGFRSERE